MNNKITTEDLINQYFTHEEAKQLHEKIAKEVEKIRLNEKRNNKRLQH